MNSNVSGGGLVCRTGNRLIIGDLRTNERTFLVNPHTQQRDTVDGVFWFMNEAAGRLYYSDQTRDHALCCMDLTSGRTALLKDVPCCGLIWYEGWLYYRNEDDGKLYRCLPDGMSESRLSEEPETGGFAIRQNRLYYAAADGIRSCGLNGSGRETVLPARVARLTMAGDWLAFADKGNGYVLSFYHLISRERKSIPSIVPASLTSDDRYFYAANRLHGCSIYRVDPAIGAHLRISGDPADHLQIADGDLYYTSRADWRRISLSGGQASDVIV